MKLQTTRFGELDVDPTEEIVFPRGLLGFPDRTRFLLLPSSTDADRPAGEATEFCWLQSTEDGGLAFVVTDPHLHVPDFRVPVGRAQLAAIGLGGGGAEAAEAVQVFVVVNKRGNTLTGNLQGPLIVNTHTRVAEQFVLSDKRFGTHVPLVNLKVEEAEPAPVITTIGAPASMSA